MYRTKWTLGVFAALVAALGPTAASAAPVTTPARTTTPRTQTHSGTAKTDPATHTTAQQTGNANAAAITAPHQAHTLLAGANHDYDGHRAKVAELVTHALHELSGHKHPAGAMANKGAAGAMANKGNANAEPQAQSDAQLRQAIQVLSGLQGQLPNTHNAATHVPSAIAELNTALKIR